MRHVVEEIELLLQRIERQHGIRIVHACESGSRAWGFASPDSDYDIRFLFVRPERDYLSVQTGMEAISLPLEGDLDAGGWDVRKAAGLLGKSNGALMEWLHSPILYRRNDDFLLRWRDVAAELFSVRAAVDHYRGLAAGMWHGKLAGDEVRAKDYLYALRAVLAAMWVVDGRGIPPVPFEELMPVAPDEVRSLVPGLLAHKAVSAEGDRMARLPGLDAFLDSALREIADAAPELKVTKVDVARLDHLLRASIRGRVVLPAAPSFTLGRVRQPDMLMFDTVAGSHAYGTAIAGSDEDRRGVFVAPPEFLLGLDGVKQVSDERNDETYYELGRFVEMLLKNNPNALELLGMPEDCVRYRHPLFSGLHAEMFLSKLCGRTFGEYAMGQIRKARGLNKKIVNPQPEQRHPLLHFCRVPEGQGSLPVLEWLAARGWIPEECGLTAVRGAAGIYAIYHDSAGALRGLVSPKDPDALICSSVPVEAIPVGWMHCNLDAFRAHCKAHREYREWMSQRNEERYATNAGHGRGYDSKNLMHTIRLLEMAMEIAREGVVHVRRPNRDFLLRVRAGEFDYDYLVERAEDMLEEVREAFATSQLPDEPDRTKANQWLVETRREFRDRCEVSAFNS